MGKLVEKPLSVAISGGDKKKILRNKPEPSNIWRSSIVKTNSKSSLTYLFLLLRDRGSSIL